MGALGQTILDKVSQTTIKFTGLASKFPAKPGNQTFFPNPLLTSVEARVSYMVESSPLVIGFWEGHGVWDGPRSKLRTARIRPDPSGPEFVSS